MKDMENECYFEFIKSKFNNLKIRWNAVQDSHEEQIQTILSDVEDASEELDQQIDELSKKYEDAEQQKIKYIKAIQGNENKILHEKDLERRS